MNARLLRRPEGAHTPCISVSLYMEAQSFKIIDLLTFTSSSQSANTLSTGFRCYFSPDVMRCGLGGSAVVCGCFSSPLWERSWRVDVGSWYVPSTVWGQKAGWCQERAHVCCVSTPQWESQVNTAQLAHSVFTGWVFWHKCIVWILKEYQSYQCIKSFNLMSVGGIGNTLV